MMKHFCEVLSASGLDLLYAELEKDWPPGRDTFRPLTSISERLRCSKKHPRC
jgi:hypothetical protein